MFHFRRLDTLRFIAFFLVFWQHGFARSFLGLSGNKTFDSIITALTLTGGVGVHIFFVISGFLITFLLIKENEISGKISIKNFYLRRVLRIWPLYYLIVLSGIFVLPYFIHTFKFDGSILKNLVFLNNFDVNNADSNIGITWSVAIEEQFYLFWPVFFSLFYKKGLLNYFSLTLFCLSTLYILINPVTSYFHTFGNINYLMIGCFGASIYSNHKERILSGLLLNRKAFYGIIFLVISIKIILDIYINVYFLAVVLPFCYLWIVIYLVGSDKSGLPGYFSNLGKYTYGMYLYHPIVLISLRIGFDLINLDYGNNLINLALATIGLVITILISKLSYNYFEKYFLTLKSKISTVRTRI